MKVCKDCRNKVWGDGVTYLPQVCIDCKYVEVNGEKEPSNWKPRPMTNADRIRAMSDEELAEFANKPRLGWGCHLCVRVTDWCDDDCEKYMLKWLKQPAEEDKQ